MTDEIGWLVERQLPEATVWLSLSPDIPGFWTKDSVAATRFGRQIDAQHWLWSQDTIDPTGVIITEHIWAGGEDGDVFSGLFDPKTKTIYKRLKAGQCPPVPSPPANAPKPGPFDFPLGEEQVA